MTSVQQNKTLNLEFNNYELHLACFSSLGFVKSSFHISNYWITGIILVNIAFGLNPKCCPFFLFALTTNPSSCQSALLYRKIKRPSKPLSSNKVLIFERKKGQNGSWGR